MVTTMALTTAIRPTWTPKFKRSQSLRRADQILIANGHGSWAECKAAREWGEERGDVAAGGMESLQVPEEDLEVSHPPDPR